MDPVLQTRREMVEIGPVLLCCGRAQPDSSGPVCRDSDRGRDPPPPAAALSLTLSRVEGGTQLPQDGPVLLSAFVDFSRCLP